MVQLSLSEELNQESKQQLQVIQADTEKSLANKDSMNQLFVAIENDIVEEKLDATKTEMAGLQKKIKMVNPSEGPSPCNSSSNDFTNFQENTPS